MKRVVLLEDLKESDIRPEIVYEEYKNLLAEDIEKHFSDTSLMKEVDCPGCSNQKFQFAFEKMGFRFSSCQQCGSLFVSPRPNTEALRTFFRDSRAGLFFRNTFLKSKSEARSKQVFSYRVQWIRGLIEEYLPDREIFLDYATKYPTLLEEVHRIGSFKLIASLLPECFEEEHLLPKDIRIFKNPDELRNRVGFFTAFEVVERTFCPEELFRDAYGICKKKGLFLMTSTTSSGFEYQLLREYSPNINPLDRLNLLSLEALTRQIERAGFEIIEISTPGRLDVEIVKRTYENNPNIPLDRFWKYLFHDRGENALNALQKYLQEFQLSSHVRIAAIKR